MRWVCKWLIVAGFRGLEMADRGEASMDELVDAFVAGFRA